MKPVVSVKELIRDFIDPASDYVFDSVGIVSNKKGAVETAPKTDGAALPDRRWSHCDAGAPRPTVAKRKTTRTACRASR